MINKLISFFSNRPESKSISNITQTIQHKDSAVDIIISLTNNGEIDLSVYIDTDGDAAKKNMFDFTQRCAEFLNAASSPKLRTQIMSIILDQIRNKNNQIIVENIIMFWSLLDKEEQDKKEKLNNKTYILPSQVFAKYVR